MPGCCRGRCRSSMNSRGLNLTYTVMSKRKLLELVEGGHVDGWDDPRMPTLVGLRRRGYTPESIRLFAERIGVSKSDSWIDISVLEDCLRDELNERAERRIAVLDPLKLVIDNYPEDGTEDCLRAEPSATSGARQPRIAADARAVDRARRLPGASAERAISGCRRAPKSGCATVTSSAASASTGTRAAR